MSKKADRRQAQIESLLKYGPQNDALTQILRGLKADLRGNVRQARATGRVVSHSALKGVDQLERAYKPALKGASAADKFLAGEIAARPEGDAFRAAAAIDVGGTKQALAHSLAGAQKGMVRRAVDARAGTVQRVAALRGQYHDDAQKVLDQLLSNREQAGLFASTRFGQLRDDAKDRGLTRRGQNVTRGNSIRSANNQFLLKYGVTRDQWKNMSPHEQAALRRKVARDNRSGTGDSGSDKPGRDWQTQTQHNAFEEKVSEALAQAKRMLREGRSRNEARGILGAGRSGQQVIDPKTGQKVNIAGVPAFGTGLRLRVALDLAYDKHLSRETVKLLRKAGYKPRLLGYRLPNADFNDAINRSPGGDRAQ